MRLLFLLPLLLSTLLSCSCTKATPEPVVTGAAPTPAPGGGAVRYLALGDSYTIGQGVPAAERWPVQLAGLSGAAGIQSPDIIAQTGWTTAELQQAIAASGNQKTYDLVSLLIGVNNQFRGQPLATYRTEFRQLLQTAIHFAGDRPGRVVVLSIPDWGQSPMGRSYDRARISQEIDQFNGAARQECATAGVAFVDITDLTRAAKDDPAQFAADGLHYSGAHMRQWATRTLPVALGLLR
ncbi:SGNH/GDSL hydrolase family protein [Hymenobacter jeollabukensis]|uniref:SGNH/GDSL hydrolase family protein n=1 Tax=Hymenobacter jeollabukensis TaxID=2025313 RepID=A0A5R8WU39_9BACT|nr:SGNH/GDSL hydrolase family protein [Hymenobacter jeollabukensis]TLM94317.1 SGNH/GDSL hydrolase family protein [Hymenobacter jeollabukensis]